RQPYCYLVFNGRYYLVDKEAVLLEDARSEPGKHDVAKVKVFSLKSNGVGKVVAFPYMNRFAEVCEAVRGRLGERGWQIYMTGDGVKVFLGSGFFILLGDGDEVERKMTLVPALLKSMVKSGEKFVGLNLRFLDSPSFIRKGAGEKGVSGT
ncbi:MAG: cell division protein FtsQ/DivIB, partial [bacterium]